jgi:hypothetical protein
MRKRYVLLSYKKLAMDGFLGAARKIQEALINPVFSSVLPTPAEVTVYIDNLQALVNQIRNGNKALLHERDNVRNAITEMLDRQALYVNQIANSDMTILGVSGFDVNKLPEKHGVPQAPKTLNVAHTGPAAAELKSERIANADVLEYEVDGPDGFCKRFIRKTAKIQLSDLPVGVILKATVRGINSYGEGPWSESVTFTVYGPTQHDGTAA